MPVPSVRLLMSALVAMSGCGVAKLSQLDVPDRFDAVSRTMDPGWPLRSALYEDKNQEEEAASVAAYWSVGTAGNQAEVVRELRTGEGSQGAGEAEQMI